MRLLRPFPALIVLGALVLSTLALVLVANGMTPVPEAAPAHGDIDTYAELIVRLQGGQDYYAALHAELLEHGYGTTSVFNWRPPAFLSTLAMLPSLEVARAALTALALLGFGAAVLATARLGGPLLATVAALLLALSQLTVFAPRAELMCELYAGALILISVACYSLNRTWLGFLAAIAALWVRELSGLYIVICILLAWRAGRRHELLAWSAALTAFAVYYGWHAHTVIGMLGPGDRDAQVGWLQFGGAQFALLTAGFNGILLVLPYAATALVLPAALVGLLARHELARPALTVFSYLMLFAVYGKPANSYWGALFAPLLCLGLSWAIPAIRDLLAASLVRPLQSSSGVPAGAPRSD